MADANVSPNSSCEQPARRALLGSLAAAGAVVAAGAPVEAAVVDPHIGWARDLECVIAHCADCADRSDAGLAPFEAERTRIEGLLLTAAAKTMPGVVTQLRLARDLLGQYGAVWTDERDLIGLRNAVASLERLTGRA